jgi:hypothetical protein
MGFYLGLKCGSTGIQRVGTTSLSGIVLMGDGMMIQERSFV